jgi:hypothetical protein
VTNAPKKFVRMKRGKIVTHYIQSPTDREALPYRAWLLLNETFRETGAARGITTWRLFQLAFILAHVPTFASRMPEFAKTPWFDPGFDEETATLLYFPTGGGKSEAFFGLLIFSLFLDRLRGKEIGVTALIRYPLRLLTLQQAQRLLGLIIRAELLRRTYAIPGNPFEIGFWVGSTNTPNNLKDERLSPVPSRDDPKHKDDTEATQDYDEVNGSFNKIPTCPYVSRRRGCDVYRQEQAKKSVFSASTTNVCGIARPREHSSRS